jgi:endonuclease YncB( thermonuclease family)
MLIELAARFPEATRSAVERRPLVAEAIAAHRYDIRQALAEEQEAEREADRNYWEPLKRELEQLRHGRR